MQSLITLLQERANLKPEQKAYIFLEDGENESSYLTFAGLDAAAQSIATQLHSRFAKGERLLLLYPYGLEFVKAFFGCLYAGVVAVPSFPPMHLMHIERIFGIVDNAGVAGILTTDEMQPLIQDQIETVGLSEKLTCFTTNAISDGNFTPASKMEGDLAYLQFSSGSTGAPKGVMITHGNLLANEKVIYEAFGHSSKTIGCGWLPFSHDMGLVGNIIQPIFYGNLMVLMSPLSFLKRPMRWLWAISHYGATSSGGPNFAFDLCVRRYKPETCVGLDLSSWEVAFCGAEPVRAKTMHRFSETFAPYGFRANAFYPCFGLAEATLMVSGPQKLTPTMVLQVDRQRLEDDQIVVPFHGSARSTELVSCGHTWQDTQVLIVDLKSLHPCSPDVIGEIWVAGGSVAAGYWKNPDATTETFHAYTAEGKGPFLRTGDLGFYHNDELFITGRLKDLIIIRGRNYFPQDIEGVLEGCHPALRPGKCAAFAVDDGNDEGLVIAAEVNQWAVNGLDIEAVVTAIQTVVGLELQISLSGLVLLASGGLPQTTSGKVRRAACREGYLAGTLNSVGRWSSEMYREA